MPTPAKAHHDYQVCQFLNHNTDYYDWVVVTAFYSALNYVQCTLFPCAIKGVHYKKFDFYYKDEFQNGSLSKHKATRALVLEHLSTISPHYQWLHDWADKSRYKPKPISAQTATTALAKLEAIRQAYFSKAADAR